MTQAWLAGILGVFGGIMVPIVGHWCLHNRLLLRVHPQVAASVLGIALALCSAGLLLLGPLALFDILPVSKAGPNGKRFFFGGVLLGVLVAKALGSYLDRRNTTRQSSR